MQALTKFFTILMRKYLPDPFIFVIILTVLTVIMGVVLQGKTPIQMIDYWGKGFWSLLAFTAQIVTMLATGYVLAMAPAVDKLINKLVVICDTPTKAIVAASLVGGVGSYLNWAFGLMVGAVVARKLAVAVKGIHYPLIMAAAYSGFVLYSTGLSATIPLLINTPGHPMQKAMGLIPLSETIFSVPIIAMTLVLLITLPILNVMCMPKKPEDVIELDPNVFKDEKNIVLEPIGPQTIAQRMNNSYIMAWIMGLLGAGYIIKYFVFGGSVDLNSINFIILFGGILLMGTSARYVKELTNGAKTTAGIMLQYPCYAGIMAMLAGSGLVNTIADWFVQISTAQTLPFWGIVSSFFINFFAPSGGGHWVIQGPFMIEAAKTLGADLGKVAQSVMLGNGWNDLIQPFWLLPTLAISGLKLSDVMPYTVIAMLWSGVVLCVGCLIWGYI